MATTSTNVNVGTDDGSYAASSLTTTRTTESWSNGSQFWRFQFVAVPPPNRCVIVSATLSLTPSVTTTRTSTTTIDAQPGASAAITSGADATARPRTDASVSIVWNASSSGAKVATVTGPVREALSAASWTPGSALTLFAERTADSGGIFSAQWSHYARDHTTAAAASKPILTVVYQPAGSSTGALSGTHTLTGGKNARGAASAGTFGTSGSRAGRKQGRGTRTGTATVIGAATGKAARRGSSIRAVTVTGARTARTARRGTLTGIVKVLAALVARTGRRGGVISGAVSITGSAAGRAARRGRPSGVAGLTGRAAARTVRAGTATPGTSGLAGTRSGVPARGGRVTGPAVVTGSGRNAAAARRGAVAGGLRGAGEVRGRFGGSGRAEGETRLSGAVAGRAEHTGTVADTAQTIGAAAGIAERFTDLANLVPLRPSWRYTATTQRSGDSHVTTRLRVQGFLADADHRAGMVEGDLVVAPHSETAITGRKGHLSDPAADLFLVGGNRRGRADRAGSSARQFTAAGTSTTARARRDGATTGALEVSGATSSGLTGRSGEAQGRASLPWREGAGTLTGQAGRRGVCVNTTGTPSGLTTGAPARAGSYAWFTRLYTRAFHISRAGRSASTQGTVAADPGTVFSSVARAGSSRGSLPRAGGRLSTSSHRSGSTTGRTSIAGRSASTRSDAAVVAGNLGIDGAVRAGRAVGGRVTGVLRFTGDLAATTARTGPAATGALTPRRSAVRGSHGGLGGVTGGYGNTGGVQAPVDFSGGVSGAATLRGHFTYTLRPPIEVRHVIVRAAPVQTVTVTVTPPLATRVKTTTAKRGTVTRG